MSDSEDPMFYQLVKCRIDTIVEEFISFLTNFKELLNYSYNTVTYDLFRGWLPGMVAGMIVNRIGNHARNHRQYFKNLNS